MRFIVSFAALMTIGLLAGQAVPSSSPPSTTSSPSSSEKPSDPAVSPSPSTPLVDAETVESGQPNDPRYGLLTPIPENGGLPRIYDKLYELTAEELRHRAAQRGYGKQIRQIRAKHFGDIKREQIRATGIALLAEFSDPAAFAPMIEELAKEKDDVRLAMLDHFAAQGADGQAALAHIVIHDKNNAIRNEAMRRMTTPVEQPALYVIERALRSQNADAANASAVLVNSLNIVQAIPLLIFAQAAGQRPAGEAVGDLAWIAITTQRAYIAGLVPVVGNGSGAFQPIIGIVSEGAILRVVDAVVIEYRTVVHDALVNMTTADWGESTEKFSYNLQAWWDWYNNVYVPFKNEQAKQQNEKAGA